MKEKNKKHSILILGASGFLGQALYKELCPYFKTYGTYRTPHAAFKNNAHFFQYNVEEDDVVELLNLTKPTVIISTLRGNFHAQVIAHTHMAEYIKAHKACKIIFLSSTNAFDAYSKYPSYELDTPLSHSIYGHFKIKIENILLKLPKRQRVIARLPMVLGAQSPRIKELKQQIKEGLPIEVFPNIIMNVTTDSKFTQQLHYIINRNKTGIFHLGSHDLVHHDDFFKDITQLLTSKKVSFKQVYTTNEDRYLAVLPKYNLLPKHLQINSTQVLEELEK